MVNLASDVHVTLPKYTTRLLQAGDYLYIGSARGAGGIAARLSRHFKAEKKAHWHIDQLTLQAQQMAAYALVGVGECSLVRALNNSRLFHSALPGLAAVIV